MRVLVFGDSITQGYWARDYGWVDLLRRFYDETKLQHLDNYTEPDVFNLGISADNSEDILNRVVFETKSRTWRGSSEKPVVVIQIGINDGCYEPDQPQVTLEKYRDNLSKMVTELQPFVTKTIFVGLSACNEDRTTPVSWGQFFYTNEHIKQYETVMAEVAQAQQIGFIPIFDQFKAQLDHGEDLLFDGLHPNDAGHQLLYEIIKPKLQELLK